jgi:NAD(P)-dependent dehydrogenase (short-subunit alcohol dehydrogenase family)
MAPNLGANFERDQKIDLPIVATKDRCHGGTFIVTGANTGLGHEAAKHFVQLSATKVILAVRSLAKGEVAKAKIEAETGIKGVAEVWPLDLGSYDSVKAFATKVNELERLDAVVENAAIALDQWSVADMGMETTMCVNVTGTMMLAGLVMPKLKESASKYPNILPHLSIVGSGVAFTAAGELEKIDGDVIDSLNDESHGSGMATRYVQDTCSIDDKCVVDRAVVQVSSVEARSAVCRSRILFAEPGLGDWRRCQLRQSGPLLV